MRTRVAARPPGRVQGEQPEDDEDGGTRDPQDGVGDLGHRDERGQPERRGQRPQEQRGLQPEDQRHGRPTAVDRSPAQDQRHRRSRDGRDREHGQQERRQHAARGPCRPWCQAATTGRLSSGPASGPGRAAACPAPTGHARTVLLLCSSRACRRGARRRLLRLRLPSGSRRQLRRRPRASAAVSESASPSDAARPLGTPSPTVRRRPARRRRPEFHAATPASMPRSPRA